MKKMIILLLLAGGCPHLYAACGCGKPKPKPPAKPTPKVAQATPSRSVTTRKEVAQASEQKISREDKEVTKTKIS